MPGTAKLRREPNGAGYITAQGYRLITVDGKPIREHRQIMQMHLGRGLRSTETVHHVNGQRADNRIRNLELWSSSHPSGQRVADKIAWAKEFLTSYLTVEELATWIAQLEPSTP